MPRFTRRRHSPHPTLHPLPSCMFALNPIPGSFPLASSRGWRGRLLVGILAPRNHPKHFRCFTFCRHIGPLLSALAPPQLVPPAVRCDAPPPPPGHGIVPLVAVRLTQLSGGQLATLLLSVPATRFDSLRRFATISLKLATVVTQPEPPGGARSPSSSTPCHPCCINLYKSLCTYQWYVHRDSALVRA